jgi:hypothetical protein
MRSIGSGRSVGHDPGAAERGDDAGLRARLEQREDAAGVIAVWVRDPDPPTSAGFITSA